ncbi:MAG: DUF4836 family protein [Bacteroidota bacterium]|nr:DUF4836 family protein [Bacteroidota bacterium]
MKAFFKFSITFIAMAFLFSSCSKKNDEGKMIPKSAIFVTAINTKSLNDKLPWEEVKQTNWYKKIYSKMSTPEWRKKILDNTGATGIDFDKELFFFVDKVSDNDYHLVVEGSLKNDKDFEQFNKNVDSGQLIRKVDGINLITLQDNNVVGWDNEHFAYVISSATATTRFYDWKGTTNSPFNSDPENDIAAQSTFCAKLFSLKSDSSLAKNEKFANLLKEPGDIHFWQNTEGIMNNSNSMGMFGMLKLDVFFKNNISTYTVNFDKGKIDVNQKIYTSKELMDVLEKYKGSNINTDMIKNIPSQNVLGILAMNFKPEGVKALIDLSGLNGLINTFTKNMSFNIDDVAKANNGNLLLSLSDLKLNTDSSVSNPFKLPHLNFIFSFGIGDKASLQKLIDAGKKITSQMGNDTMVHYAMNDKTFAISNSGSFVNQFIAGNNNKYNFTEKLSGHPIVFFIDIHKILLELSTQLPNNNDEKNLLTTSLKTWDNITTTGGDFKDHALTINTEINMVDQNTNSLKQLNNYMDEMLTIAEDRETRNNKEKRLDSLLTPPPIDTVKVK